MARPIATADAGHRQLLGKTTSSTMSSMRGLRRSRLIRLSDSAGASERHFPPRHGGKARNSEHHRDVASFGDVVDDVAAIMIRRRDSPARRDHPQRGRFFRNRRPTSTRLMVGRFEIVAGAPLDVVVTLITLHVSVSMRSTLCGAGVSPRCISHQERVMMSEWAPSRAPYDLPSKDVTLIRL